MTNPHEEITPAEVDPSALAVHSESDQTRTHGDADETQRVQSTTGLRPVDEDEAGSAAGTGADPGDVPPAGTR